MKLHGTCIYTLHKDLHHSGEADSTLSGPGISGGCVSHLCLCGTVMVPSFSFLSLLNSATVSLLKRLKSCMRQGWSKTDQRENPVPQTCVVVGSRQANLQPGRGRAEGPWRALPSARCWSWEQQWMESWGLWGAAARVPCSQELQLPLILPSYTCARWSILPKSCLSAHFEKLSSFTLR